MMDLFVYLVNPPNIITMKPKSASLVNKDINSAVNYKYVLMALKLYKNSLVI